MDAAKLAQLAAQAKELPSALDRPLDPEVDLHVDGDYCAYYYSGNDETEFYTAKANMLDALRVVARIAGAGGKIIIHVTSGDSDKGKRFDIATIKPYQGQRDPGRKPKNWDALRNWIESGVFSEPFRVVQWHDREADDGVAAAARYALQTGRVPAIYSRDKDFRMIPGRHVVWTTYDVVEVKPETWELAVEGDVYGQKWFWLQMIQGDSADNIPGLEGVPKSGKGFKACGPACATAALFSAKNSLEAFTVVQQMYETYYAGAWADRMVEQAALLWMRNDNKADVADFMKAIPVGGDMRRALDKAVANLRRRLK